MPIRVAVSGGTGFIGSHVVQSFLDDEAEVIIITRDAQKYRFTGTITGKGRVTALSWDDLEEQLPQLEGLDAWINLSGESINQRWSTSAKQRILHSRLKVTSQVAKIVGLLEQKPKVVINGSGMSIYGLSETDVFDETSPAVIDHYLSDVVEQWEAAADLIQGTRVVKLRIGLVLGYNGGALPKMMLPYKLFVGGRIGSGQQWLSWIHIKDMVGIIKYCISDETIQGAVNCTAPHPVTNNEFGKVIGRALRRPHYFPIPAWVFKLIFGEMSILLLSGQKVLPQKMLQHHYKFHFSNMDDALVDITRQK